MIQHLIRNYPTPQIFIFQLPCRAPDVNSRHQYFIAIHLPHSYQQSLVVTCNPNLSARKLHMLYVYIWLYISLRTRIVSFQLHHRLDKSQGPYLWFGGCTMTYPNVFYDALRTEVKISQHGRHWRVLPDGFMTRLFCLPSKSGRLWSSATEIHDQVMKQGQKIPEYFAHVDKRACRDECIYCTCIKSIYMYILI